MNSMALERERECVELILKLSYQGKLVLTRAIAEELAVLERLVEVKGWRLNSLLSIWLTFLRSATLALKLGITVAVVRQLLRELESLAKIHYRVVLQKLFKDRAILTISSRSRSNSKNLRHRQHAVVLLETECLLFLLRWFVPCGSCSLFRTSSKFALPCWTSRIPFLDWLTAYPMNK